jgi:hypothetical protein
MENARLASRAPNFKLRHYRRAYEGNPTACLSATAAGLPDVEDLLHYQRQSLVFLSTFA